MKEITVHNLDRICIQDKIKLVVLVKVQISNMERTHAYEGVLI